MTSIKQKYFNARQSGSYSGMYSFVRNRKIKVSRDQVRKELLKLKEYYSFFPAKKKFQRRKIFVPFNNLFYCSDLIILPQKYFKDNKPYRIILTFLDMFSRRLSVFLLKDKKPESIIIAMKKLLKQIKKPMSYLNTDQGKLSLLLYDNYI